MDIVRAAISKPVAVTVGVILVVMFGLIGLGAIPVQLAPNVDRPIIRVETEWTGRTPQEIVDEITKEQEDTLKNVSNLKNMRSVSTEGQSEITLEFYIGTNVDRALQEVSDSLREVPEYPPDAEEPVVEASSGADENAIAWMIIDLPPDKRDDYPNFDPSTLHDALDKHVKPYLERIDGLAEINIFGGREREVRVLTDHNALAQRGLSHVDLVSALQAENENTTAGTIAEGKRDYRVRVMGRFTDPEQVRRTVIAYSDGSPIYVEDVADVEVGYEKKRGFVRSLGTQAIAMNAIRQTGSNVMNVMEGLRSRLDEVRADILPTLDPEVGPDLRLRQVYDETVYITSAIDLVTQNLWVGGGIAALVLLFFLRSVVSTGVIALAIPISVIGTFLALLGMGRTLNVVSLAGLAFAVGMVVDNAIVVLENIHRRLQTGEPRLTAAYRGGKEVWGAILASTLTTLAVFIPMLTIQEEAGQLFRDISLAIVAAVALSLIVSITVIPAATSRWLRADEGRHSWLRRAWENLFGLAPLFRRFVERFGSFVHWLISGWRGWSLRPAIILALTVASLGGAWILLPPMDYLPAGNRNLVFGGLLIPPGYSIDQREKISNRIEAQVQPYAEADIDDPQSVAKLPPIPRPREAPNDPFDPVPVANYFIGSFAGSMFVGATSQDPRVVLPVGQLLSNAMNSVPDAFGGAQQSSLFGRGAGGGGTIDVEILGPDLNEVRDAAGFLFDLASQRYGLDSVQPDPSNFNLTQPEWRVRLNRFGRELGLTTRDLGVSARALFDGAFVGDYELDGENVDLVVIPKGGRLAHKEELPSIPIATPAGRTVPLDSVAEVVPASAPQEIQRIEELPAVTLRITPPKDRPLENVMAEIRREMLAPAQEQGLLGPSMRVRLEGTAAKLDEVRASLFGQADDNGVGAPLRAALFGAGGLAALIGAALAAVATYRSARRRRAGLLYGAVGALLLGGVLGALFGVFGSSPHLITARFIWALIVTYLLMAALFESFVYPFVILFSVPLALIGGVIGLRIVHEYTSQNPVLAPQQLDVLTMLGFVILIGIVVNNAILLVHQARHFMRGWSAEGEAQEPMPALEAIAQAVRTRIRPIFMSAMTSVGGMTPLVLFPGAGSELYRGLGSVVIGGLLMATLFTLVLVPLLFSLVVQMRQGLVEALAPAQLPQRHRPTPPRAEEAETEPREPALETV